MLFLVALLAPCVGWGQDLDAGISIGYSDGSIVGPATRPQGVACLNAGLWGEVLPQEWWGVKAQLEYLQQGGNTDERQYSVERVGFSIVPRLHLADGDGPIGLVLGAGAALDFPHLSGDIRKSLDLGPCVEIGLSWKYISVLIRGKVGSADVDASLAKRQRLVNAGVGLWVRLL